MADTQLTEDHEILSLMTGLGMPLCEQLREMLNEHYSHCSERRGCGYTQATRVLSGYINTPRQTSGMADWELFSEPLARSLPDLLAQAASHGLSSGDWRNLDINPAVTAYLASRKDGDRDDFDRELARQCAYQRALRSAPDQVTREESRMLLGMLRDVILPVPDDDLPDLPSRPEKPKVGSCTLAEKFFLEIAHNPMIRRGRINVMVDGAGKPVLLEKLYMGDSHSCLSLATVRMNGVRLPPGSLFAAEYPEELLDTPLRACRKLKGKIIPLTSVSGFRFLRLTTLAIPPSIRPRAFGAQLERQAVSDFIGYDTTELTSFRQIAAEQF